jgi:hypothetical protein
MKRLFSSPLAAAALVAMGAPNVIRARTRDTALTFDSAMLPLEPLDGYGNMRGKVLDHAYRTWDGKRTVDSTGAFLIGELERLDQTINTPLAAVTWSRDIELREDVTIADEVSSFTLTGFGSAGNLGTGNGVRNGKAWIGKATDQIGGVGVDTGKIPNPLTPWGLEIKYSILELESAAKMGRPIDAQKYEALQLKLQMDTDEQVYVGDATLNVGGLVNNALVTNIANVPNGAGGSPLWSNKTPNEILADVNEIIFSAWAQSAFAVLPNRLLLPPLKFGYINATPVTTAGTGSILKFIMENNLLVAQGLGNLVIAPAKWLVGAGVGGNIGVSGTDRMVAYRKDKKYVRFPMTPLQRTPVQYDSIYHKSTYFCRLGVVEVVYPETLAYRDGF